MKWLSPSTMIATIFFLAESSGALEKRAVPFDEEGFPQWNAGYSHRVSYYNICTGWVWCWSGFGDDGVVATTFDLTPFCGIGETGGLLQTTHFLCSPAPSGYGFTGTIAIHESDGLGCPKGRPIASQPFLPSVSPFQTVPWGGLSVPSKFVLLIRLSEDRGLWNPAMFGTDHPAAGPTGPMACGNCYPSNRAIHSYFTNFISPGTHETVRCPGFRFDDGVCEAELFWDVDVFCGTSPGISSVDPSSWGMIKSLYR